MKKIIKNCLLYLFVVLILLNVLLFKESSAIKGLIFISSIVAFLTSIPCVFCVNKLLKIEIKNNILKYLIYFLLFPFVLLFVFGFGFTFLLSVIVGLIFTIFRFDAFGLGGTPSVIIIACTVTMIALYIKMLIEKINFKNKL
ncbi:MAG: hypothetical protein PUA68_04790 [Bacilli bacterium]|nr:hypothetical protein [Bacilli bacterium]